MFTKATMPGTVLGACDKTEKNSLPLCSLHCDTGDIKMYIYVKRKKKLQNERKSCSLYEIGKKKLLQDKRIWCG